MEEEYIKKSELFDKTVRRNHAWNMTTNSEGKGLEEIVNDLPTYSIPDSPEPKEGAEMTREEKIDWLCRLRSNLKWFMPERHRAEFTQALTETISALSENKGEWIPVTERLPEKFRFVNCTCHSLIDDREDWVVETVYVPQPSNSPYSDWGNIPMLNDKECEVIAWVYRDIPEPYKAEKGGE